MSAPKDDAGRLDEPDVAAFWESNAPAWTALVRAGYDLMRDRVNTPAFVAMLGDVTGLRGLDIGCGEGANTRTLARLGARMTGVDLAPTFVAAASDAEEREPLGIAYEVANAASLPFGDGTFDFAASFMALMDCAEYEGAVREAYRVVRPGGFLQFSIIHPCFSPPHVRRITGERGVVTAVEVGGYFDRASFIEEWTFSAAPTDVLEQWPPFRIPVFHRTLSDWLNALVDAGFTIRRVAEPRASEEDVRAHIGLSMLRTIALFLLVRAEKPG